MADLSITAVRPTPQTRVGIVTYGATVSSGQSLYLDTSDQEYKLADASLVGTAAATVIALTPGVDGGSGVVAFDGPLIFVGPTMTVGVDYVVSATAGGIAPKSDLSSGDFITDLGRASTTTQIEFSPNATGIQVP